MSATIKKVDSANSPRGDKGEYLLAEGKNVAMRMWKETPADTEGKTDHSHAYETVGYVISGRATLHVEGQSVTLSAGDSWLVPGGAKHHYEVEEDFVAVEATSPPAREQ